MPDLPMDVAVANRFISSLSKSLQALCHGCMDFDSGIEIVGYINVNIDCGSKVDYVLNEKVLKSTTNSMTFVSNSFLAKKDVPKQTRDGACSPIPELRPLHQTSYHRGGYQGPRSSMQFAQSFSHRGSQKRPWPGLERDWRMSPKKYRGGRIGHPSPYQMASSPQNPALTQTSLSGPQSTEPDFKIPQATSEDSSSDVSAVNVKKEITDSDNGEHTSQSEQDQTFNEKSNESLQPPDMNIKKDPDASNITDPPETDQQITEDSSATNADADFKDTFLHPADGSNNSGSNAEGTGDSASDTIEQQAELTSMQSDTTSNIPEEFGATSDNFSENLPSGSGEYGEAGDEGYSQSAYSDAGEGSSDAGQFEVIEIEDEDEDVQGLFGDSHQHHTSSQMQMKPSHSQRVFFPGANMSLPKQPHSLVGGNLGLSYPIANTSLPKMPLGLMGYHECPHCPMTFIGAFEMKAHISSEHGDLLPYRCEECGKGYNTSGGLYLHKKTHKGVSHSCPVCHLRFVQKSSVRRHMVKAHSDIIDNQSFMEN